MCVCVCGGGGVEVLRLIKIFEKLKKLGLGVGRKGGVLSLMTFKQKKTKKLLC